MKMLALGPAGTNGHEVAKLFSANILVEDTIEFCELNEDILERVAHDTNTVGVVPIENSKAGLVREVVDFWLKPENQEKVSVLGKISIPISHRLFYHPDADFNEVDTIVSHPQALAQCRKGIDSLPVKIKYRLPSTSTAAAARDLSEGKLSPSVAIIASPFAGTTYHLKEWEQANIQGVINNSTRFHLVGRRNFKMLPSKKDCTALIFYIPDQPRSLCNILNCISMNNTNMTSIHSIPLGNESEYAFYVEFDTHLFSSEGEKIMACLRTVTERIILLGTFGIK